MKESKQARKKASKKERKEERKTAGRACVRLCAMDGALTLQKGALRARSAERKTEKEKLLDDE